MELQGWEYKIERQTVGSDEDLEAVRDALNNDGSEGWEMVSVLAANIQDDVELMVFYKRPVELRRPTTTISTEQVNELVDEAKDLLEKRRHEPPS